MIVKVPDIQHPTKCWKQYNPTKPPFEYAMYRCHYLPGHAGPHAWEVANMVMAYVREHPGRLPTSIISSALGLDYDCVKKMLRSLRKDGFIEPTEEVKRRRALGLRGQTRSTPR